MIFYHHGVFPKLQIAYYHQLYNLQLSDIIGHLLKLMDYLLNDPHWSLKMRLIHEELNFRILLP